MLDSLSLKNLHIKPLFTTLFQMSYRRKMYTPLYTAYGISKTAQDIASVYEYTVLFLK